jgi:flavin reductase (DIM6/NTAB) family NADH-FMN oxidoreductase RutF
MRQQRCMTLPVDDFRKAMGCFATGVTILTMENAGTVHGMTANAFASVSLEPLLVLVCVDHGTLTHELVRKKERFGINVLAADQERISRYYADPDRLHHDAEEKAGARFDRTGHGTPILRGALAYLECRLTSAQPAGDHTIFVAAVENAVVRGRDPLLFFRGDYHQVGGRIG